MDSEARRIVTTALAVHGSTPQAPALDVLDLAMEGRHDTHPSFEATNEAFGDWCDPPSPFAALLAAAFPPHEAEGLDAFTPDGAEPADRSITASHVAVLERFADRYRLWR